MIQRRKFIKQAAVGAAAITAAAAGFPHILTNKKKERLGVALVGLGYYSTDLLAPALQLTQNCYLAGIVTGSPEKAERWKKQHNLPDKNIYNYDNFDKIADNPDIDVVYVVLPPVLHKEFTVRAANAGKHVWCEKPMAMTAAECEAMIKACADNKVKLTIGYRMQHEPNTQEIIGYARDKTFGKIKMISVAAGYFDGRTDHWQEKTTRPEIYHRADETTIFQLEFPSGALANCATSLGMSMNYLNVTAEKGWYKLDPFQSYSGIQGESSKGKLNLKIPNQQAKQMDDDALAIMNNTALIVPGEEGWRDIKVVEAIHLSATEGRRVVIS